MADAADVAAVDLESFPGFWRFGVADVERVAAGERLMLAERNGEVIGYTLCTVSRGAGILSRLAVRPGSRRIGLGSALLADAAHYVARAGGVTLTLCTQESNEASRALYARAGMVEVDERYGLAVLEIAGG
jgi:ribosomal-protein-alanine N-acetyltransferase